MDDDEKQGVELIERGGLYVSIASVRRRFSLSGFDMK